MTIVLSTPPYQQFYDLNGDPLSGGKVYTYLAGTTTPTATYTDQGGLTQCSNPIILDSAGRGVWWLDNGVTYKYVVKDSLDNIIETVDTVVPFTVASSSLATIAANTIVGNNTGATTSPLALTRPQVHTMLGQEMAQEFRLTLTSATPVTTTDVTGATTIYCTPYKGNRIALYDGSTGWTNYVSSEFSLALGTLTSGKPYDVFCYANSGVPTLEFLVWTNDTTRATALVYQDGVLVKSGATTRRYLGTFYTTSTTQTEDSLVKRFLWNYYNRVARPMLRRETTASWNYSTNTVRQANASSSNQLDFVRGVDEDAVSVSLSVNAVNSGANPVSVGLGLDTTSAYNIGQGGGFLPNNTYGGGSASYNGLPGLGRHYIAWLECSLALGTTTWYGNNTVVGSTAYSGISGMVLS